MPADLYLGLDLGTSGARAVVIDASGETLASGKAAMADFGAEPSRSRHVVEGGPRGD